MGRATPTRHRKEKSHQAGSLGHSYFYEDFMKSHQAGSLGHTYFYVHWEEDREKVDGECIMVIL